MRRAWPLLLLVATVVGVLLLMEWKTPYYFLQDDNRDMFLPMFTHAFDALKNGQLALYNFHQFLGTPDLAIGQTGVMYPPIYAALGASLLLFGHVFAGIDLLVGFHLVVGAVGMYYLVRTLDLSRTSAFLAGLSWVLCSYVVYFGNSWVVYTALAAWLPFLLAGAARMLRKPGPAPTALLVATGTTLFLVGYPQNFLYGILFEILFLLLLAASGYAGEAGRLRALKRTLPWYGLVFTATTIACAPLLLPMLEQMSISASRSSVLPYNAFIQGAAVVKDVVKGLTDPFTQGVSLNSAQLYSFVGRPLLFLALVAFLLGAVRFVRAVVPLGFPPESAKETAEGRRVLSIWCASVPLGVFGFLWATNTWISPLLYMVPILNRFRWPSRLLIFFLFFLILLGAAGMQILMNRMDFRKNADTAGKGPLGRIPWRRVVAAGSILLVLGLQVYDLSHLYLDYPRKVLKTMSEPLPLTEPFAAIIGNERLASVGFDVGTSRSALTLGYNYAAQWGLYHFAGYETFVSEDNASHSLGLNYDAMIGRNGGSEVEITAKTLDTLRAWGVRWYVAPTGKPSSALAGMVRVAADEDRVLYRDDLAVPMAFVAEGEENLADGVELEIGTNTLTLRTDRSTESDVVVAFLSNAGFSLTLDGRPSVLESDDLGRMTYKVPAGRHVARITYRNRNFERGLWVLSGGLIALGAVVLVRRNRRWKASLPVPSPVDG
jgi:hypothetical protein